MTPWAQAEMALALMRSYPVGLGGIVLRGRVGPARDAFLRLVVKTDTKQAKLHPNMTNDALDGSLDLTQTLSTGHIAMHAGLLTKTDHLFTLAMAERTPPYLAARLAMALDAGEMRGFIALDEGADETEGLSPVIADRLAFRVDLNGIAMGDITGTPPPASGPAIATPDGLAEQLTLLALRLGINSLRAPIFALRAAKAHAALHGRSTVTDDDVGAAVALVYAHRATQIPADDDPQPPTPDTPPDQSGPSTQDTQIPDDMLLDAVMSALPAGLLDQLQSGAGKNGAGAGSGKLILGNRRGRPLSPRDRTARKSDRIDLLGTLRAAVPWQTLRKQQTSTTRPVIRPADLRARRYQNLSDRVLIFAVDASGSAALARLNEAKGAIEILLSEAYSRRDHVALISFRGTEAETLLPPTRSLVQTKRRLAALPGGGGTPLAAGLQAAMILAQATQKRGQTPTIVVLTDGRSNVALDGTGNRAQAAADATDMGQQIRKTGIDSIVIDTGARPDQSLSQLATAMAGHYIALPRANAERLSDSVSSHLMA